MKPCIIIGMSGSFALLLAGCAPSVTTKFQVTGALPSQASAYVLAVDEAEPADPRVKQLQQCLATVGMSADGKPAYVVQIGRTVRAGNVQVLLADTQEAPSSARGSKKPVETLILTITDIATGAETFRAIAARPVKAKRPDAAELLPGQLCDAIRQPAPLQAH